jgi:ubiquinone/menaquinone biosynthesis C-methylase UbiE
MKLSEVFTDAAVARAYRRRPTYPPETFEILDRLIVEPRVVLDVGAGTGAIARRLLRYAKRVDAVDPSAAMIAEGRRLPGGDDPKLHWISGTAETAPLDPPYGLITAGTSLHWMDLATVIRRFAAALAPGGKLAVLEVVETPVGPTPWNDAATDIIKQYSELKADHVDSFAAVLTDLEARGLFEREGDQLTRSTKTTLTVSEWLEWMHSTSTLARVRLGDRAARFDADIRALFARLRLSAFAFEIQGRVVWGRPVAA